MADEITLDLDQAALAALLSGSAGPVHRAVERACIRVQSKATALCPVDTGRLRASISYRLGREDGEVAGYVGSNVEYAVYVEFGTSRMGAKPYLRPAVTALKGTLA